MPEFPQEFKRPPFPQLRGRLHIFPALIPMVELIPWLLGLVGAAAGVTSLAFWRQHKKYVLLFALLCFIGAGMVWGWKKAHIPTDEEGSRILAQSDWPKVTVTGEPPAYAPEKQYDAFTALWSAPLKNEPLAGPVVAGNLLLLGTFAATVEALSKADGKPVWSVQKHEPVFTNPVVAGNKIYAGEGLHTAVSAGLTAMTTDGKILWERQFLSHVESPPLVHEAEHRLWTGAGDESLWSLDTRDGHVIWRQKVGHIDATPLLVKGTLYVTSWPDAKVHTTNLIALDPDTGAVKWSAPMKGDIMGSPQEGPEGNLLVTTAIGQVGPLTPTDKGWAHAVSADGKLLWTVELPTIALPEPAVLMDRELVILTLKTGQLLALHAKDGSVAWNVTLGKAFDAPATLRDDTNPPLLAAISSEGHVALLDAEDGTQIRAFDVKQGGYVAPMFDGDVLYVTTPREIIAYGGVHLLTRGAK